MPSTLQPTDRFHVAIIMDGNGRWAVARGLTRTDGHRAGVKTARAIVEAAPGLGISILTLFAFSSDNWQRPANEISALMWLLRGFLRADISRLLREDVRLVVLGRRDRIPNGLRKDIHRIERATAGGKRLELRIAVDYSARDSIVAAARECAARKAFGRDDFARALVASSAASNGCAPAVDVDLLIRTGGERRLSDFLLWESAYAELIFCDRMWPEFTPEVLSAAVAEFRGRERRFGALMNHHGRDDYHGGEL
jgi:undecaprenyl diphosphate synthase